MQKANLILPPIEKLTLADFARRFVMTKNVRSIAKLQPRTGRLWEDVFNPEVCREVEHSLVPLPVGRAKKNINLLELIGIATDGSVTGRLGCIYVGLSPNTACGERNVIAASDGQRLFCYFNAPQELIDFIKGEWRRIKGTDEPTRMEHICDKRGHVVGEKQVETGVFLIRQALSMDASENAGSYEEYLKRNCFEYMGRNYVFDTYCIFPDFSRVIPQFFHYKAPSVWEKRGYLYAADNLLYSVDTPASVCYDVEDHYYKGDGFSIAFNPSHLIDALKAFEAMGMEPETLCNDAVTPVEITGDDGDGGRLVYVMMPMRGVNWYDRLVHISRMSAPPPDKWLLRETTYMGKKMPPCFLPDCAEPAVDEQPEDEPEAKNEAAAVVA